jgi:hypothetical protein
MRKLEIADPEIMRIAIQQEILRSDESRYDHRLHGLLLLTSGKLPADCRSVWRRPSHRAALGQAL